MKFTLSWLKRFLDTNKSLSEISTALTSLGFEVEEIIDKSSLLKDFTVAQIKSTKPHPAADKLKICEVERLTDNLQIVCGAPNARSGIKVVLAKVGSLIPKGNFKIKEAEIRGVKSYGMLCSEAELQIGKNSDGIIELPSNAKVGDEIAHYYGLDDPVIVINVTPNRADGLGIYGIARELAARGLGQLKEIVPPNIHASFESELRIRVNDPVSCPLFAVREIRNVTNKQSPIWLKHLLQNIGLTPISAIIDITNYITYCFAQPLHAYDKAKIDSELQVKVLAEEEEQEFHALNDRKYKLIKGDIVIASSEQIDCLAGIIGSNSSACDENTTNIILEAAVFTPSYITTTAQRLQINTDARLRFERGVDTEFTTIALNLATNIIIEICGGEASRVIYKESPDKQVNQPIKFPITFLQEYTGLTLTAYEIKDILLKLGCKIQEVEDNILQIIPPSWRHDLKIKEDIIEEITRLYGYEKLPFIALPQDNPIRIITKEYKQQEQLKRILASLGYDEVVTWSFMKDSLAQYFTEIQQELLVINPISSDLNYMRPSIMPNLLQLVAKNQARSFKDIALFEAGPVFISTLPKQKMGQESVQEVPMFAGIKSGSKIPRSWQHKEKSYEVYDIKADLESLFVNANLLDFNKLQIRTDSLPAYYHPTRTASLNLGKNIIVFFGQIHPKTAQLFDIDIEVFAFEIHIANIPLSKEKFGYKPPLILSNYQSSVRDFCFIVDLQIAAGEILNFIRSIDKNLIKDVTIFDIYSAPEAVHDTILAKKSIALSVTIQSMTHTLTESELNNLSQLIITKVEQKFDAKLRT